MSEIPTCLVSQEYLDKLIGFTEASFDKSYMGGRRRTLGGLVMGRVYAQWRGENDESVLLAEHGVRFRNSVVFPFKPISLHIFEKNPSGQSSITQFEMDLYDVGSIDVYRQLIVDGSLREVIAGRMVRSSEEFYDMNNPTDEDRLLLYRELERGASGLYAVRNAGTELEH